MTFKFIFPVYVFIMVLLLAQIQADSKNNIIRELRSKILNRLLDTNSNVIFTYEEKYDFNREYDNLNEIEDKNNEIEESSLKNEFTNYDGQQRNNYNLKILRKHQTDRFLKIEELKEEIIQIINGANLSLKAKESLYKKIKELLDKLESNKCNLQNPNESKLIAENMEKDTFKIYKYIKPNVRTNKDRYNIIERDILKRISNYFYTFINDITALSMKYKLQCRMAVRNETELEDTNKRELNLRSREQYSINREEVKTTAVIKEKYKINLCKEYKICAGELEIFLSEFYEKLNDTVSTTLKNYGEMYVKDVNTDASVEPEIIVNTINRVIDNIEPKITAIFEMHTDALITLIKNKDWGDLNKKQLNMLLRKYIKKCTDKVTNETSRILDEEFNFLRSRLQNAIKKDIVMNVNIEMDNLGSNVNEKMCSIFDICHEKNKKKDKKNRKLQLDRKRPGYTVTNTTYNHIKDATTFKQTTIKLDSVTDFVNENSADTKTAQPTKNLDLETNSVNKIIVTRTTNAQTERRKVNTFILFQ